MSKNLRVNSDSNFSDRANPIRVPFLPQEDEMN